jgi:hypothetical protein
MSELMKEPCQLRVARTMAHMVGSGEHGHIVEVQGREAALAPRSVPLERPVGGESQSPQHGEKG